MTEKKSDLKTHQHLKLFTTGQNLDQPNLKAFADNTIMATQKFEFLFGKIEIYVKTG